MSSCSDNDIDLKSCTYQKVKKIKDKFLLPELTTSAACSMKMLSLRFSLQLNG